MADSFTIRSATAADIPAMRELLGLLFDLEQDFVPDPERQTAGLKLLLSSPLATVFVAEAADGRVAGLCGVQLSVSTAEGGWSGEIEDLVLFPEFRRHGLGARLIEAGWEWCRARGAVRLRLNCDDKNFPAIDFYAKNGWERSHLVIWFKHPAL